jgi:methyl-accepting chemotaxis protein
MAGAVEVFKNNMIEAERLRAEQLEADKRQAEQRKADMRKLADAFEGAVGEIVETVSSAATELEASAATLTKAAERSERLATTVATASEKASTNVQSVSSASEELTTSVNEISRQVQESSRVANEAVDQAQKTNGRVSEAVEGGKPHRRRGRTDQYHRRPDQSVGAERHDRGGARRRGRPRLCRGGIRGEGARRADGEGHRRDQSADSGIQAATQDSVGAIKEIGAPSAACRRFPRPLPPRWKSRARRRRKILPQHPAGCDGTREVSPTSRRAARRARGPDRPRRRFIRRRNRCRAKSNRLKLEVSKFLNSVRVA